MSGNGLEEKRIGFSEGLDMEEKRGMAGTFPSLLLLLYFLHHSFSSSSFFSSVIFKN